MPVPESKVWAHELQAQYDVSIAISCQVICFIRTANYYKPKLSDDSEINDVLYELTDKHNRWSFPNCFKRTHLAEWHSYPKQIRVDNGSEFTSSTFTDWASAHNIFIDYIVPSCPYQNAFIERLNRSYCNEVLDCYLFNSLDEVSLLTEDWIKVYNNERPHDSLNDMTPAEYRQVA